MASELAPLVVGIASLGPAIGIGLLTAAFFNGVSRQPEVAGKLTGTFFIAAGMIELLGLLGFITFIMAKG